MALKSPAVFYGGQVAQIQAADQLPIAAIATGTPDGTKFVRDDGVLATPTAGAVADNSITNLKLADVATSTLKGRVTALTGDPEDLTVAQVRTLLVITNIDNTSDVTKNAAVVTLTNKVIDGGDFL